MSWFLIIYLLGNLLVTVILSFFLEMLVKLIHALVIFIVLFFLRWVQIVVFFGLALLLCLGRFLFGLLGFFGMGFVGLVFFGLGQGFSGFDFIDLIVENLGFREFFAKYQLLYLLMRVKVMMKYFEDYYNFKQNRLLFYF